MSRSPRPQRAVDGHAPVKRNRYIQLSGATKSVNRQLEAKTRALAGWKGYTTNLTKASPEFVIDAYHQLWRIEKAFRMSKHDLQARPIYHHTRESIEAHLSIVFAAMAVSHYIEHPNRLEHQEIRPHHPPLPHREDQSRPPDPDCRRPATRRPPRRAGQDRLRRCALVWPNSGWSNDGSSGLSIVSNSGVTNCGASRADSRSHEPKVGGFIAEVTRSLPHTWHQAIANLLRVIAVSVQLVLE